MNIYTNLIYIAHFIFSHCLHYFNRQYECLMNDLKVDIRNDGVVQNYFGEQRIDISVIHQIHDHLAKVVKLIKDNHDCNKQIQTFLVNVLDIQTQRFTNVI